MDDLVTYLQAQGIATPIQKGSIAESPDTVLALRETGGYPASHTMARAALYTPFPSTSILDTFARANENPLGNGTWLPLLSSASLRLVSNQAVANTSLMGASYWTTAVGPDCECYVTVATRPDEGNVVNLFLRLSEVGVGWHNGYLAQFKRSVAGLRIACYKVVGGAAFTLLAETEVGVWSDGERIGASIEGARIRLWKGTATGAGAELASVLDGTHSSAGYLAVQVGGLLSQNGQLVNFGGGTGVRGAGQAILEEPTVQIVARAMAYDTAETLIRSIKTLLDGLRNQTINGVQYHWVSALQPPFLLERDANQRFVLAFNVHVKRQTV